MLSVMTDRNAAFGITREIIARARSRIIGRKDTAATGRDLSGGQICIVRKCWKKCEVFVVLPVLSPRRTIANRG